ncbi:MAG: 30S ribosomal protein S5 [Clostridiales bacterium]|nr:30S ribosomal protein S5 [Clostridiales bacterium]
MADLEKVKRERPRRENNDRRQDDGFDKVLVEVRRVTKVVKGGRTMRFSAIVVVGDRKGSVGIGTGKAKEVPLAIDKATAAAKKNLIKIATCETTIPHEMTGKFGASSVHLIPAKPGTGVIAGGAARSIIELAGIKDIVTKRHGSSNKINLVKATLNGLKALKTKEQIAARRGIAVEEI